jgi:hypothetical protein
MVKHDREGDFEKNVVSEYLASLVNEEFIDLVRLCSEAIPSGDYLTMMLHFQENLRRRESRTSPILRRYLSRLDQALSAWLRAL